MTTTRTSSSIVFVTIGAAFGVLVLSQLVGPSLFDNNWNLIHWQLFPTWYKIAWAATAVILALVALRFSEKVGALVSTRTRTIASLVVVLLVFVVCQFDSFLYGGGNLRVAQIAQAERIVFRWYEFGSTGFVSLPYQLYKLFGVPVNNASVYAWKTYAFICTALTIAGSAYFVRLLFDAPARRVWAFIIILFGAHTFSLLGFVGVEPILPASAIWTLALGYQYYMAGSARTLRLMWAVVAVSIVLFIGAVYLLPAAVLATIIRPGQKLRRKPIVFAVITLIIGIVVVYTLAHRYPAVAAQILMVEGKRPFTDYGLFSFRHFGDMLQMRAVLSPVVMAAVFLWLLKIRLQSTYLITLSLILTLSALIASVLIDPVNGAPLDLPIVAAYMLPLAVFALTVFAWFGETPTDNRIIASVAVVSVLCVAAVAPSYVRITQAEPYVTAYFEQQPRFYRTGGLALRDAYFYLREFDRANYWDQKLPVLSDDYLNYRGCLDLAATTQSAEAAKILARVVAANPYWTEPRSLLAICNITIGRTSVAKPHIDTCLMLKPYEKEHQMNLYRYYFATGNRAGAVRYLEQMRHYFPYSPDVLAEVMMNWLTDGRSAEADSLAAALIARDSMLALPYLAKGRIADGMKDTTEAIEYYQKFMVFGKYRPEAAAVGRRMYELRRPAAGNTP